jgi:hypothetical protein
MTPPYDHPNVEHAEHFPTAPKFRLTVSPVTPPDGERVVANGDTSKSQSNCETRGATPFRCAQYELSSIRSQQEEVKSQKVDGAKLPRPKSSSECL